MKGFIKASNLSRRYKLPGGASLTAVDIDELHLSLGGIIAIVGGSGSGKTTLLNLLGSLEPCDSGSALTLKLPGEQFERVLVGQGIEQKGFPYQNVSYIFQQGYLLNQASLAINLAITRRAAGYKADDDSLKQLLQRAQLQHDHDNSTTKQLSDRAVTLSGGQQQRINIARALGREPSIVFADELTSSLDPIKAHAVMEELRQWIWQDAVSGSTHSEDSSQADRSTLSRTLLWVTHDYALAAQFADAILVLYRGTLATGAHQPIECSQLSRKPNIEQLKEWVQEGIVPDMPTRKIKGINTSSESLLSTDLPSFPEADTGIRNRINGLSAAIGNMKDGIVLSLYDAYRPSTSNRQENPDVLSWLSTLLVPFISFSHWVKALQLAAVVALIMIVTFGQAEVIDYFDEQLSDPSLRHVIVQQNTLQLQRSVIDEESLARLSIDIAKLNPRYQSSTLQGTAANDAQAQSVAFGRFTESVDVYKQGEDRLVNPGFLAEVTIGIFERGEPVYAEMDVGVLDVLGSSCDALDRSTPSELIPYGDELAIVITRDYLQRFQLMNDMNLCDSPYMDIWDAGDPKTFRVVGVVDRAPADGYEQFDVLMQDDVWRTWVSRVGRPPIDSFSRAAVYFNQSNSSGVIDQLRERAFAYDQEIVDKFQRLIATAAKLRNTFLVITWLTLGIAAMVAAGLIWGYLMQNAQSIAVLRAHAAWVWPLIAAIPFQLLLTFIYSLFYLFLALVLWNFTVSISAIQTLLLSISDGGWTPTQVSMAMVAPTIPWVLSSFGVMLLVGWLCLYFWSLSHQQLAHELRQAY